jgi:hypothetical protein
LVGFIRPDSGHDWLEKQISGKQAQDQRQSHGFAGPTGFRKKQQQGGQGNTDHTMISQSGIQGHEPIQQGASQALYRVQDGVVQRKNPGHKRAFFLRLDFVGD